MDCPRHTPALFFMSLGIIGFIIHSRLLVTLAPCQITFIALSSSLYGLHVPIWITYISRLMYFLRLILCVRK